VRVDASFSPTRSLTEYLPRYPSSLVPITALLCVPMAVRSHHHHTCRHETTTCHKTGPVRQTSRYMVAGAGSHQLHQENPGSQRPIYKNKHTVLSPAPPGNGDAIVKHPPRHPGNLQDQPRRLLFGIFPCWPGTLDHHAGDSHAVVWGGRVLPALSSWMGVYLRYLGRWAHWHSTCSYLTSRR